MKVTPFQQSLEEEGVAERRRLAALHQQRVLAHLAQRRRTALACYTRSLRDTPPNVSSHPSFILQSASYERFSLS